MSTRAPMALTSFNRTTDGGVAATPDRRNRLLDSLNEDDRQAVFRNLAYVDVAGGTCLSVLGEDGPVACFPLTLVASIVDVMADGSRYEVGMVGSEGMIGWQGLLGARPANQAGVAQLDGGVALIMPAAVLGDLCRRSLTLQAALLPFVHSYMVQMSHTIVANLRDGIDRRLARWLLMLHDRIDGDTMALTHGELAAALNVRRASITDTLHILEGDRVLRCTRGQLVIRDRAALAAVAGDSYGPAEAAYRALLGEFGKN